MDSTVEELRQIKNLMRRNNELLEEVLKSEQLVHDVIKWDLVPLLQKIEMR